MVVTKLPVQRAAREGKGRDWWRSAACRDVDPELFFPVASQGPGAEETARAKEFCAGCGVRRECLQYALATRQMHGVWGGTSEDERRLRAAEPSADLPRQRPGTEPGDGGTRGRDGRIRLA
jgi:WhiB family redox-sensing transcriptional regulator